ncbi:PAP2 family protein [Caballeronia calidae]|uniref:PAP2 family protein n=1 Tax=Caballeronia calidae TaxID=1777139 RepID=A0A158BSG6_9BURK|nr:PAP2 family protein [Caballeronia calidae]
MYGKPTLSTGKPQLSNRKRYLYGWAIVGIVLLVDVFWLQLGGYSVVFPDEVKEKGKVLLPVICGCAVLYGIQHIPRYRQVCLKLRYYEVANTVAWFVLLIVFIRATSVLSYLCITMDMPLVENSLLRFDQVIGFDWPAVYGWVQSHPAVRQILGFAYASGFWQLIGIPAVLGLLGRREDLSMFFFLLALSSIYLLVVSTPFPATSAFEHFKVSDTDALSSVSDFSVLRDGSMRTFDLQRTQGLVSLPSFHTALAVIFAYSLRRILFLFWPAVILDVLMIASTPTQGGHYLGDVLAGLVLSALTIVSVTFLLDREAVVQFNVSTRIARHATGLFAALNDRLRRS